MTIDEAIAHAREVAKDKRKEMQCKTCKLFARSDLHPLQGYCRKNEFRSIEIDSWRKVCSEYVPKEMCKCTEEHEQLAEWLEELKMLRELKEEHRKIGNIEGFNKGYNKAIDDFIAKCENAKFAESDEIALSDIHTGVNSGLSMAIHFAEQLKAGEQND